MSLAEQLQQSRLISLPNRLYEITQPNQFSQLSLANVNFHLLEQLGIDHQSFSCEAIISFLLDNQTSFTKVSGTSPRLLQTISTVYAGHQFGVYTSRLGDGRVHILGDITAYDGTRWEVQLKGAGPTPYARGNTGRMSLAEAITEYLGCEAMSGLGIPSTRGMALINHSQNTINSKAQESIFVRTAHSHLRFGHFEFLHNQGDLPLLKELADFVIEHHYPELLIHDDKSRYLQFLFVVTQRSAQLVAQWQSVGFVHSVMNTDNMSILGITMDYGVYGFMEAYDPGYSPNENDDQDRYAFNQQIDVARWNCLALAEALIELLPGKRIPAALLRHYRKAYNETYQLLMRKKLGLSESHSDDVALISNLLDLLHHYNIDYTRFFRCLSHDINASEVLIAEMANNTHRKAELSAWFERLRKRLALETMDIPERQTKMLAINPKYVLRRNVLDQVINHAEQEHDFTPLNELLLVLQSPYLEHELHEHLS